MAKITGKPRYLPEIQWSKKSWVHNVFRLYELVFFRRFGIRCESSVAPNPDGTTTYRFHTFEAFCAFVETQIRNLAKFRLPLKIWVPELSTVGGMKIGMPFSLAIALDTSTAEASGNSTFVSWSHTCTGSNLILIIDSYVALGQFSSATYNSVSLTSVATIGNTNTMTTSRLVNPATGANTAQINISPSGRGSGVSRSYSGAHQTVPVDSSNTGIASNAIITVNTTVVGSNCWLLGASWDQGGSGGTTDTSGATDRQHGASGFTTNTAFCVSDSNGTVSTGSQGITFTSNTGSTPKAVAIVWSLAPFVAAATGNTGMLMGI